MQICASTLHGQISWKANLPWIQQLPSNQVSYCTWLITYLEGNGHYTTTLLPFDVPGFDGWVRLTFYPQHFWEFLGVFGRTMFSMWEFMNWTYNKQLVSLCMLSIYGHHLPRNLSALCLKTHLHCPGCSTWQVDSAGTTNGANEPWVFL